MDPKYPPLLTRIAEALERLAPPPPLSAGLGDADAFIWHPHGARLQPVPQVARVKLALLRGVEPQRDRLLANTVQFAAGRPANNAMLWGARGMGKSSLVKAAHAEALARHPAALALIEIAREDINTLPLLMELLRASTRRCLVFCDDLSFEKEDSDYKALKSVLDGGIAGRPENVLFYATSNRRHLMPRDMIENERGSAINPGEAVEEKVSLSDRFGLWIGFHNCDQPTYLAMVEGYASDLALPIEPAALQAEAIAWSAGRGGRSGRVAWQFIQDLAGRLGAANGGECAMIATEQVPGVYRRQLGDVLVTALSDGHAVFPPDLLQGISPAEREALLRAAGRRPPFTTAINAFVLQWPGRTVLVDAGSGTLMGPSAGKLMHNLQEAGLSAASIDAVLMTHLHGDHFGGLVGGDGLPAFPNADLLVPEAEMAFWLDDAMMAAAPEGRRSGFTGARQSTACYGARLRRFSGSQPVQGVEAVALPGHTPGHTGYMVGSGADRLLIWGDICHVPEVQCPKPDVTLPFDSDQALAAKTRRDILARAAAEDLLLTGMHMNFPGFTRIARAGDAYVAQAEVWQGALAIG